MIASLCGLKLIPTCATLATITKNAAPTMSGHTAFATVLKHFSVCSPILLVPKSDSDGPDSIVSITSRNATMIRSPNHFIR